MCKVGAINELYGPMLNHATMHCPGTTHLEENQEEQNEIIK